jgi:hypothetical protein
MYPREAGSAGTMRRRQNSLGNAEEIEPATNHQGSRNLNVRVGRSDSNDR